MRTLAESLRPDATDGIARRTDDAGGYPIRPEADKMARRQRLTDMQKQAEAQQNAGYSTSDQVANAFGVAWDTALAAYRQQHPEIGGASVIGICDTIGAAAFFREFVPLLWPSTATAATENAARLHFSRTFPLEKAGYRYQAYRSAVVEYIAVRYGRPSPHLQAVQDRLAAKDLRSDLSPLPESVQIKVYGRVVKPTGAGMGVA